MLMLFLASGPPYSGASYRRSGSDASSGPAYPAIACGPLVVSRVPAAVGRFIFYL